MKEKAPAVPSAIVAAKPAKALAISPVDQAQALRPKHALHHALIQNGSLAHPAIQNGALCRRHDV
jgi:hypothetical protein